ncbi:MAG: hypothetical protein WCP10_02160 [Desulfuromonadales bacterium]
MNDTPDSSAVEEEYYEELSTGHRAALLVGKTAAGLGVGVVAGIGMVVAASAIEVLVPAFLLLKAFGLTGAAVGFVQGLKKD